MTGGIVIILYISVLADFSRLLPAEASCLEMVEAGSFAKARRFDVKKALIHQCLIPLLFLHNKNKIGPAHRLFNKFLWRVRI